MLIREAEQKDIPEIISVLKASLGEEDLPLSQEIWKYKHQNNPFGESLVLIATENDQITGIRAFMKWNWQVGQKVYSTYRAVDTATHPNFQGKGIFKNLTLKAVSIGVDLKDDFVFNTPNEKSRPGYFKMGWELVGNIKVGLQPAWNSFYRISKRDFKYNIQAFASNLQLDKLCNHWNSILENKGKIFTPKSRAYLKWRYENNPLQKYEVHFTEELYIAGYIKIRKNIRELRISECIYSKSENSRLIRSILKKWSTKFGAQVISYSPDLFTAHGISIKGNFGPGLTVRNLNLASTDFEAKTLIENWSYSLGDLELF